MFDKIKIRNYSTNKKLDIEFGPFVTSLIGSSFTGKSAALRALRWVVRNKPSGDNFINWDSEKSSVKIYFDGKKVLRRKGKGINLYKLNKKEFKAFGNDIPQEIQKLFNMSDINFQGQHDRPFWFCETAGEVSRQLNNIINLDVIDSTLAKIASKIKKTKMAIEISQEKFKEITEKRRQLAYIKEINKALKCLESLDCVHQDKTVKLAKMLDLLELAIKYRTQRDNAAQRASEAKKTITKGVRYREIKGQVKRLLNLIKNAYIYIEIIDNRPPDFNPIKKKKQKLEALENKSDNLKNLLDTIFKRTNKLEETKQKIKESKRQLKKLTGDRCPLCLRPKLKK